MYQILIQWQKFTQANRIDHFETKLTSWYIAKWISAQKPRASQVYGHQSKFQVSSMTQLPGCLNHIEQPVVLALNNRRLWKMEGPFVNSSGFQSLKKKKVFKFIYQDSDRTGAKIHCSWFKVQGSLLGYTSLESNAVFPNPDCTLANVGHALKNTDMWSQDPRTCGFVNPAGIILSNQGNTCLIHSSEISGTVINTIQSKQSWTCQSVKSKVSLSALSVDKSSFQKPAFCITLQLVYSFICYVFPSVIPPEPDNNPPPSSFSWGGNWGQRVNTLSTSLAKHQRS